MFVESFANEVELAHGLCVNFRRAGKVLIETHLLQF